MNKVLGLFVFVTLLLSACAPAIPGSSSNSPIDARDFDEITITAGSEWFALTTVPAGLIGRSTRDQVLRNLFAPGDYVVGTKKSASINWYKIQDFKAPSGWVIEIAGQNAFREITRVEPGLYYSIDYEEITWLIKAPPTTPAGQYRIQISVANRINSDKTFVDYFTVNINIGRAIKQ